MTALTEEKVTPAAIRLAVEWLAANANGVSLLDWEPRSQTLLNAANEIDLLRGLLAEATEALKDWDDDPVDGEPWIVRAKAALEGP